jgi:hypothetical protein
VKPTQQRKEEKKRWYFVRETFGTPGFAVLSHVFYSYDDAYLYERSGKRTPRVSSWRTWYDSETKAVGCRFSEVNRSIKGLKGDIARQENLREQLAAELNRLIDAEHGATLAP